jgi:4'-phosphopantetheinyl transferase
MQPTPHHPKSIIWTWAKIPSTTGKELVSPACLSTADRARADRFRRSEDRLRFVAGRGLLAALLRQTAPTPPVPLELALTEHGRPFLPSSPDLVFSISHAGDVVAVALARGARVGLDVEALDRRVDLPALAKRILNPADLARFSAVAEPDRARAFFRAWTGKEAVLKAKGLGLFGGLEPIAAPLDDRPATLTEQADTWHLRPLPLPEGYVGCIACDDPARELVRHEFSLEQVFQN